MKLFEKEGSKKALGLEEEVNTWLAQHPKIKSLISGSPQAVGAYTILDSSFQFGTKTPNKALHRLAIPLRFIAGGEFGRHA